MLKNKQSIATNTEIRQFIEIQNEYLKMTITNKLRGPEKQDDNKKRSGGYKNQTETQRMKSTVSEV